eukprot:m.171721 g.171721  ORF g.171721 m.171721 type:complete len:340 (+) comp17281_c0_seq5:1797-2816(+)
MAVARSGWLQSLRNTSMPKNGRTLSRRMARHGCGGLKTNHLFWICHKALLSRQGITTLQPHLRVEERPVEAALILMQAAKQHLLVTPRQLDLALHVLLEALQHVLGDGVAQGEGALVGDLDGLLGGVSVAAHSDGHLKLVAEERQRAEAAGVDEVKERPQLTQVVLHGRARQDQPVGRAQLLGRNRDLGVGVSDLVALVQNGVVPAVADKLVALGAEEGVGGEEDVAWPAAGSQGDGRVVALVGARGVVHDDAEGRPPAVELGHPLVDDSGRAHDEHGAARLAANMLARGLRPGIEPIAVQQVLLAVVQANEKGNELHRFPEAHLVAENAAAPLHVQAP